MIWFVYLMWQLLRIFRCGSLWFLGFYVDRNSYLRSLFLSYEWPLRLIDLRKGGSFRFTAHGRWLVDAISGSIGGRRSGSWVRCELSVARRLVSFLWGLFLLVLLRRWVRCKLSFSSRGVLDQCLSTGCVVHPKVYQNFPWVYHCDGMYRGVPDVCSSRIVTLSHKCSSLQHSVLTFHRF